MALKRIEISDEILNKLAILENNGLLIKNSKDLGDIISKYIERGINSIELDNNIQILLKNTLYLAKQTNSEDKINEELKEALKRMNSELLLEL